MTDHRLRIVLGPTNTGKTRLAIERMVAHGSGMIGLPLRLLAREVYDRVVTARGLGAAALITGEERIVPETARYFICTVEAMPVTRQVDFVAIDEVQLCADPDRGHVFTDRILHARGRHETMLLGAETVRTLLHTLVPGGEHDTRERMSTLTYSGPTKLTKLPRRSAVVAFSAEEVYAIAELLKRQRGGAAVVMGALSPATRNAQVELYQQGEVDFLVATDAIGMGLNMDVDHVAFAALAKFDGHRRRPLRADEIAQIAGRAGRHIRDGSFGVTADAREPGPDIVARIENHRFEQVEKCQWRNSALDYDSLAALDRSLMRRPTLKRVIRKGDAVDHLTLQAVMQDDTLAARATGPTMVRRIWEVCQLPDFRKTTLDAHVRLVSGLLNALTSSHGVLQDAWMAAQIRGLDDVTGDVDVLSGRLAHMRTWAYVAQRRDWLDDNTFWRGETAAIEARLSEALHDRLTQRFVDRRTATLLRALRAREDHLGAIADDGTVLVDGVRVGVLRGLVFHPEDRGKEFHARTARKVAEKTVRPEIDQRLTALASADAAALTLTDEGALRWQDAVIATLKPGAHFLRPEVRLVSSDLGQAGLARDAEQHLRALLHADIAAKLEVLTQWETASQDVENGPTGAGRGLLFHLLEHHGSSDRRAVRDTLTLLTREDRAILRRLGVRFGEFTIYAPKLLKPAPARLIAILRAVARSVPVTLPPTGGEIVIPLEAGVPPAAYRAVGFRPCGTVGVRFDLLERLADALREAKRQKDGQFALVTALRALLGVDEETLKRVLQSLGYKRVRQSSTPGEEHAGPPMPEYWRRLRHNEQSRAPRRDDMSKAATPRGKRAVPADAASSQKGPASGNPKGKGKPRHTSKPVPQRDPARIAPDPDSPFAALAEWQRERVAKARKS